MALGEAVIVAGIGCRKGAAAAEIRDAIAAARRKRGKSNGADLALGELAVVFEERIGEARGAGNYRWYPVCRRDLDGDQVEVGYRA